MVCVDETGVLSTLSMASYVFHTDGTVQLSGTSVFFTCSDDDSRIVLSASATPIRFEKSVRESAIVTLKHKGLYMSGDGEGRLVFSRAPYEWVLVDPSPSPSPSPDREHHVVVSRYHEDVAWVRFIPYQVYLYNKGVDGLTPAALDRPNIVVVRLENRGREGDTYLHHIINFYDRLPGRCTFLQGNPFDHNPDLLDALCNGDFSGVGYQGLSRWWARYKVPPAHLTMKYMPSTGFTCVDYKIDNTLHMVEFRADSGIESCIRMYKRENGMPTAEPVVPHFLKRAGLGRFCGESYMFSISALFSCLGTQVRNLTLQEWSALRRVLLERSQQGGREGYILERLWRTFLDS